ncbi:hypothetical protein [Streptomyces sp. NBC_01450]|uniref:hypothetical protein n=1 Tax=Streptomyces sp. NBC_01450 TaxID=2903871 RepID=UPI003FCE605D
MPFHPLELGEDAPRALCGFVPDRSLACDKIAAAIDVSPVAPRTPDGPPPPSCPLERHRVEQLYDNDCGTEGK